MKVEAFEQKRTVIELNLEMTVKEANELVRSLERIYGTGNPLIKQIRDEIINNCESVRP